MHAEGPRFKSLHPPGRAIQISSGIDLVYASTYNPAIPSSSAQPPEAARTQREVLGFKTWEGAQPELLSNIISAKSSASALPADDETSLDPIPTAPVLPTATSVSTGSTADVDGLPEGWMVLFDEKWHTPYYTNITTGQSQWEKPPV